MRRSLVMAANIATTAAVRPTVIFLHGSGDTGRGVEGWLRSLAPPALGFTRAAVVGMLGKLARCRASRLWLRYQITGECWKKHCGPSAGTTRRDIRLPAKKGSRD